MLNDKTMALRDVLVRAKVAELNARTKERLDRAAQTIVNNGRAEWAASNAASLMEAAVDAMVVERCCEVMSWSAALAEEVNDDTAAKRAREEVTVMLDTLQDRLNRMRSRLDEQVVECSVQVAAALTKAVSLI